MKERTTTSKRNTRQVRNPRHPLRLWRLERNLNAAQIAERLSCSVQSVWRYEAGRMPEQPFLDRIVILTAGEVDANAWLGEEAANVVAT